MCAALDEQGPSLPRSVFEGASPEQGVCQHCLLCLDDIQNRCACCGRLGDRLAHDAVPGTSRVLKTLFLWSGALLYRAFTGARDPQDRREEKGGERMRGSRTLTAVCLSRGWVAD